MPASSESKEKRKLASENGHSSPLTTWPELLKTVIKSSRRQRIGRVLPGPDTLSWGLQCAGASTETCDLIRELALLAFNTSDASTAPSWSAAAERLPDLIRESTASPIGGAVVIAWAYALPNLAEPLGDELWWRTLEELQVLCQAAKEQTPRESWQQLLLVGELPAVLAWRLPDLPSCLALRKLSKGTFQEWGRAKEASVTASFQQGGRFARLTLASAVRQSILCKPHDKKLKKFQTDTMRWIGEGLCVSMRPDGSQALGPTATIPEDEGLFLSTAKICENKSVLKAKKRATAKGEQTLKHAAEAELPEPFVNEPNAYYLSWRADWGRQHGRIAVDFSNGSVNLEVGGGRSSVLCGPWDAVIVVDGVEMKPTSSWEQTCWFTDDEVHYLEMTQSYSEDIDLHRQILLLREDDILVMGDAVVTTGSGKINYLGRVSVGKEMMVRKEQETRELIISDPKKDRAVVMPLALPEWRVARAPGTLDHAEDRLELSMTGNGRLEASLMVMLNPHKFAAQRTWRQLTVGENLQPIPRNVAVSYRVQIGNDQYVIYRTLAEPASRTFLGQNIASEFYMGRFDPTEGIAEELVSVETE
jgi:hypothetical protein